MKTCEWCGEEYAKRKSEAHWQAEAALRFLLSVRAVAA